MKTVTPLDLRRSLGRILDEASAGQRFLIERDRRPLAVLVSVEEAARLDEDADDALRRRRLAVERLEDWRRRILEARGRDDAGRGATAAEMVRRERDERDARDQLRATRGGDPRPEDR
jgi:prevent-host-death family protein